LPEGEEKKSEVGRDPCMLGEQKGRGGRRFAAGPRSIAAGRGGGNNVEFPVALIRGKKKKARVRSGIREKKREEKKRRYWKLVYLVIREEGRASTLVIFLEAKRRR